jgi:hypothetical protein
MIELGMFCKKCGYPLAGLSQARCARCGRAYDPDKPNTFLRQKPMGLHWYGWAAVVWNLLMLALLAALFAAYVAGMIQSSSDREKLNWIAAGMFFIAIGWFPPVFLLTCLPTVMALRRFPQLLRRERALILVPWLMIPALMIAFLGASIVLAFITHP